MIWAVVIANNVRISEKNRREICFLVSLICFALVFGFVFTQKKNTKKVMKSAIFRTCVCWSVFRCRCCHTKEIKIQCTFNRLCRSARAQFAIPPHHQHISNKIYDTIFSSSSSQWTSSSSSTLLLFCAICLLKNTFTCFHWRYKLLLFCFALI